MNFIKRFQILMLLASGHLILSEKNSTEERVKRNNNEYLIQSRRLNDGKGYSSVYNKLQPPSPTSHGRLRHASRPKPLYVPPYAVKMEPLVQYSQRDPLYHDKEITYNISSGDIEKLSKVDTFAESTNNFVDYAPRYGPSNNFEVGSTFPHHYYKEPEPIIEIIIKESNESLSTPPTTASSQISTKEPIQVFYVKYKKNPTHTGKEEVVYEEPIPALTPLSTDIVENNAVTESYYSLATYQSSTPPSTTYRTIIRPDSEVYHGTGLKVTFGNHEESTYPLHRSSEAQKRDSVIDQSETQIDYKSPQTTNLQQPPKHLLEQRQGQISNDFARFADVKQELSSPSHNPNHITLTEVQQQPLQFEDGSFEQPPPPSFPPQNQPQQKVTFPAPHANIPNIPFRPQHTFNFPQTIDQQHQLNNEFRPTDLGLLQRQPPQNQFPILYPHSQINIASQHGKLFPRLTQTLLQQYQFAQNQQQFPSQEPSFSPQILNNVKSQHLLLNDANRFPNRQNFINVGNDVLTKTNRGIQQSTNEHNIVSYNPQLLHSQATYTRNEFLQQPFLNQKPQQQTFQQPHSQEQHQQQLQFNQLQQPQQRVQQLQQVQPQQQQLPLPLPPPSSQQPLSIEKQKQFQYDNTRQQMQVSQKISQRRPIEKEKYSGGTDFFNQKIPDGNKLSNTQPNYHEILTTNQQRLSSKPPKQSSKNDSSSTVSPIKDGQIYKSVSHSEEHQILNQLDSFGPSQTQQHFNIKLNSNFGNTLLTSDLNNYQRPKQAFGKEKHIVQQNTSSKPVTIKNEIQNNTSQFEFQNTNRGKTAHGNKKKEPTSREQKEKSKSDLPAQLAALPAEVPDDLREQLLASGILSNADIQILDYDKVGDIPIENLPPEALENLYGAGSAPVPSISFANATKSVEMKVVRYDPSTSDGKNVEKTYVQEDSTEVDPVVLNDSSYNRYLPLKIKGSQFPIPDTPLLKNKKITSVVVLAPVDYDYVQQEAQRQGKSVPQVHGVRFISGDNLKTLVKNPSENNFVKWIEKERQTPPHKQSVILLVAK